MITLMKNQIPWGSYIETNLTVIVILLFTAWGGSVPFVARKLFPNVKRVVVYSAMAISLILLVFLFQLFGYQVR